MSDRHVGWVFVGVQVALLTSLVVMRGGDDFDPPQWLDLAAATAVLAGAGLAVAAALGLGRSLTPTPVPSGAGTLHTGGLYRLARHPIYTGVIVIVVALAASSGSVVAVAVGAATVAFFHVKARWEERRLVARYPGYAEYAARTPRFLPLRRPGSGRAG